MLETKNESRIEIEEDTTVDLGTSCTIAVAAAKMLGWFQSPQSKKMTNITKSEIVSDDLPYLLKREGTFERQLEKIHKCAVNELDAAIEDYERCFDGSKEKKYQVIKNKIESLKEKVKTVEQIFIYKMDITRELAKNGLSALKIDQEATEKNGVTCITIESLHDWAKKKYGIIVCPILDQYCEETNTVEQPDVQSPDVQPEDDEFVLDKGLDKTKATNVLTTLAFLAEAFAETAPTYRNGDKPNYNSIAKKISGLAEKANGGISLSGQSERTIRDLLSFANETKLQAINRKGEGA